MSTVNQPKGETVAQLTPINPHPWTTALGFDQAQLIEAHRRLLVCSGQDAVDADGKPQHPGDMAAQLELALDNLRDIVAAADVDELLNHHSPRIPPRFGDSRYATSVLGVDHLPARFLVMLEATAVD